MNLSRRSLLAGASALTVLAPGVKAAFGATDGDVLVVIFQRGACDWLQMLAPVGDQNYIAARPSIRVTATTGNNGGVGIATMSGTDIYLHNAAPQLKTLYDSKELAFVHAAGLYTSDRSHFTCQSKMERGTADADPSQSTGWLARHLNSTAVTGALPTVSLSSSNPASLLGDATAVAMTNVSQFNVSGGTRNAQALRSIVAGSTAYSAVAKETLDAVATVQSGLQTINTATANTAGYTGGPLSNALRAVGQLIRMNVGLNLVTVDYGSWDMHNNLVGEFRARTTEFSAAIGAFWTDMADFRQRITLVTMTEFGRRLQENSSQGTDHGAASGMLVLGGNVNGGKIYGTWPGLAADQLTSGDLRVTTDYRQVLSEILVKRHGEKNLANVFPTISYSPLGLLRS